MLDSEEIKFIVDEHYYNKDIVKASAHVQLIDTDRTFGDKKTLGYHLLGYEFDEWFTTSFEWQSPPDRRGVINRFQPAVIFDFDIMEEEMLPVVINAKRVSNNISTASAIIAYDVTPNGLKKKELAQPFILVTEVYTNREGNAFNYPAGNNANVLNVFVPMAKVPDFVYDFCYEAMQQIFLFNTMMHTKKDDDQEKLFNLMTPKAQEGVTNDSLNVWQHIEDNREKPTDRADDKTVVFNQNIGASYPGQTEHTTTSLANAWDVIDVFIQQLDLAVDGFVRNKLLPYDIKSYSNGFYDAKVKQRRWGEDKKHPSIEGEYLHRRGDFVFDVDGETVVEGDYVAYDKTIKEHYEQMAFAAFGNNPALLNHLVQAKDMFDHVYSNNKFKEDESDMVTIHLWDGRVHCDSADVLDYRSVKDTTDRAWMVEHYPVAQHHGKDLKFPKFFWDRVISHKESAIPASRTASWVDFAEDASFDKDLVKYEAPAIENLPGLDSYVIEDVYIHNPGSEAAHDNFLLAIMFGCYDAFMAAAGPRYRGLPDRYVLADHGRRNRRNNDRYVSVKRSTGVWDEKKMRPKQIHFTTPKPQVQAGGKDFRALLEATITPEKAAPQVKPSKKQIRPVSSREFKIELEESTA
jgi:hypothetical protein